MAGLLDSIDELEKEATRHEEAAAAIRGQLAAVRDRLAGVTRKPKSGKFSKRARKLRDAADAKALGEQLATDRLAASNE